MPALELAARLGVLVVVPRHVRLELGLLAKDAVEAPLQGVRDVLLLLLDAHEHLALLRVDLLQLLHQVVRQELLLALHRVVRLEVLELERFYLRGVRAGARALARRLQLRRLELAAKLDDVVGRVLGGCHGARASRARRIGSEGTRSLGVLFQPVTI